MDYKEDRAPYPAKKKILDPHCQRPKTTLPINKCLVIHGKTI